MASDKDMESGVWEKVRVIGGLFLAFFTVFAIISLVSYLFTWIPDQSLNSDPEFSDIKVIATNWGGKMGYKLAHLLFAGLFGFGAFAVPVFTAISAVACLRVREVHILKVFLLCIFGCVVVSLTCSFVGSLFPSYVALFEQGTGGSYGYYINEWLVSMIGSFGTGFLVLFLLCVLGVGMSMRMSRRVVLWITRSLKRLFTIRPKRRRKVEKVASEDEQSESDEGGSAETETVEDAREDAREDAENTGPDSQTAGASETDAVSNAEELHTDGDYVIPLSDVTGDFRQDDYPADEQSAEEKKEADLNPATEQHADDETAGGMSSEKMPYDTTETDTEGHRIENQLDEGTREDGNGDNPPLDVLSPDDPEALPESKWRERYDPRLSLSHYKLPSADLLDEYKGKRFIPTRDELEQNNIRIVQALKSYKIAITKVSAKVGPTVTLFEVVPAPGVKVSQIKSREEDIARELAAVGVRVVFIPGSNAIGIEVANAKPSIVSMRSILEDRKFQETKMDLPVAIGKTISNDTMMFDLARMPHLLVAGATGQGKSVGLNAIITSLLYKKHPSELKFVLVDPKKVELSLYSPIENHYLAKLPEAEEAIITDTDRVVYTLKSLCKLMDRRYDLLKAARVRNIKEYNEKFLSRQLNPLKGHDFMPYIVVIIDEFADLLMTAGKDVEDPITRLAQLARAIGIHLVIATQRPTTNIITGTIKANFPARIAFKVMTGIDSKTILDQTGANRLIGRGDMLIATGSTEPVRVQCALVDTPEVTKLTEFIHSQTGFGTAYLLPEYNPEGEEGGYSSGPARKVKGSDRDELFEAAARLIVREQAGSTSLLQRKMEVGFARAGRIMDQLHEAGIVGPSEGSKARQVRVTSEEALERILDELS